MSIRSTPKIDEISPSKKKAFFFTTSPSIPPVRKKKIPYIYIYGKKKILTGGRWWNGGFFGRLPLDFGLPDRLKIFWGGYGKLRSWSCEIRWVCSIQSGLSYVSVRKSNKDFPKSDRLRDFTILGFFMFLFQSSPYIGPKPHITSHNIIQHHITSYNII